MWISIFLSAALVVSLFLTSLHQSLSTSLLRTILLILFHMEHWVSLTPSSLTSNSLSSSHNSFPMPFSFSFNTVPSIGRVKVEERVPFSSPQPVSTLKSPSFSRFSPSSPSLHFHRSFPYSHHQCIFSSDLHAHSVSSSHRFSHSSSNQDLRSSSNQDLQAFVPPSSQNPSFTPDPIAPTVSSNVPPLHVLSSHSSCFNLALGRDLNHTASITSSCSSQLAVASPYCLQVSAPNRISSWTSPFSIQRRCSLEASLPLTLVDSVFCTIHNALILNTRTTYAAGILRFTQFCDSWSIPEEARMPASATLLAAFISQCRGLYAGNTICSWLSGICS